MSGLALTLTWDGLGVRRAMDGLIDLGANLRTEILEPIGDELRASARERFRDGVGPDGEAWAPSLRVKLNGGQTLLDDGYLQESIRDDVFDDAVEIGSDRPYAAIHQFGGTITAKTSGGLRFRLADGAHRRVQSVKMPARPFLGLSAEDGRMIEGVAEAALIRVFDRSVG